MPERKENTVEIKETFGADQKSIDKLFIAKFVERADPFSLPSFPSNELRQLANELVDLVDKGNDEKNLIAGQIAEKQDYFRNFIESHYSDVRGWGHEAYIDEDEAEIKVNENSGQVDIEVVVRASKFAKRSGEKSYLVQTYALHASPEAVAYYTGEIKPKLEKFSKLRKEEEERLHRDLEELRALVEERGEGVHLTSKDWGSLFGFSRGWF